MKALFLFLLPIPFLIGSLCAQEDVPPKHLRFIPLGELPVWEEELRDGIRRGIEPPAGSMPPNPASVVSGAEPLPLRLTLRSFTEMVTIDGATPQLLLKKGELGAAQDWLKSKMPASRLSLGILYRDPATMTWNNPKMLLLDDTSSAFPGGSVRFANVSDTLVLVQLGDPNARPTPKIFGVPAGRTTQKSLKAGNNQIRVGYLAANGQKVWIWSNQIRTLQNQRLQTFFYKAQGEKPRHPVMFHFTPEPLPRIPGNS